MCVSIPFIAGQWSLRGTRSPGAVFPCVVSIPFIAGQWSLPGIAPWENEWIKSFQSPSLRGSGRFSSGSARTPIVRACFNPLHCGAVVASRSSSGCPGGGPAFQSPSLRGSGRFLHVQRQQRRRVPRFQSPSLRGSGRFGRRRPSPNRSRAEFQSPSLRGSGRFRRRGSDDPPPSAGFNPLHCGAVVASWCPSLGVWLTFCCFNPLHCGAVVASLCAGTSVLVVQILFQSPSLRGSGRFAGARLGG